MLRVEGCWRSKKLVMLQTGERILMLRAWGVYAFYAPLETQ